MAITTKIEWHGEERKKEIEVRLERNMLKACLLVERDAKINAPVDTGRLRASITHELETEKDELTGIVGTNVAYAKYQEFGTSKMPAHPFLFPALEANKEKIRDILKGE